VTEMPVEMNGPRAAVDAPHNVKAPIQPEDPDDRLHAAWFAEPSGCSLSKFLSKVAAAQAFPQVRWSRPIACPERRSVPRRRGALALL
jgi:hypothetical protein